MIEQRAPREPSERLAGRGHEVYLAGALALTEPGPAAAGLVVLDERGRTLAHRSQYLGQATRGEAVTQALLAALRLAVDNAMEAPVFKLDDRALVDALQNGTTLPGAAASVADTIRELLAELPGARFEYAAAVANEARPVALAPLIDWLPERARRAEDVQVRAVGPDTYEIASTSQPGQVYRVTIPANGGAPSCQCADFEYRGIPCKHLLAVAREAGGVERLFYRAPRARAGEER